MNYKLEGALKKSKKTFILCIILWLVMTIVFVAPITYSNFQANIGGKFDLELFLEKLPQNIMNPFGTLGGIFGNGIFHNFMSFLIVFTVFYLVLFFIGLSKSAPKNRYVDIEHGSSDWSEKGSQYKILSKNKGIILAEDNYLPVDKRGNVNVLVVGRFWFW